MKEYSKRAAESATTHGAKSNRGAGSSTGGQSVATNGLQSMRHSLAHIMASAVQNLWPEAKFGVGPVVENGFYYDIDLDRKQLSEEDFGRIEKEMHKIIKANQSFERQELPIDDAIKWAKDNKQPYKQELLNDLKRAGTTVAKELDAEELGLTATGDSKVENVSFYKNGNFTDLCRGPHVESTGKVGVFKLMRISGAYWRGKETNPQMQRIYGVAFDTDKELRTHLTMLEEAKKRDHRKLGQELELFTFSDLVGSGLPLFTPKGTIIREELEKWAKETEKEKGYLRVATPHIAKHTLFEISGHLPYYKDDMYSPMLIDDEEYYLKGMNCPHHHMIYKSKPRSYKDLPLRFAEYGAVYRYEQSGTLFGLMRVRFICENDAHIYCSEEHAEEEFLNVLKLHEYYYNTLGLTKDDYHIVIGLPDESKRDKYHGDKALWDKAEKMMRSAIKKSAIRSADDIGGAAFYGPKVDFNIKSSIGREFGISTNQLDLYMPTRFNLEYTDKNGEKKLCAVIHRAPLGSHERFIGFLIEHFGGAFPAWLAPLQIKVIPITENQAEYAK